MTSQTTGVVVEIGGLPVRLSTGNPTLLGIIQNRYAAFIPAGPAPAAFDLRFEVVADLVSPVEDIRVTRSGSCWRLERSDFEAECSPQARRGWVRQSNPNPYSVDTVLRVLHSLLLASEGGFLLHAASAVRKSRALIFTGLSGAGKTTISRLAPPDVTLLTDEISYIRQHEGRYWAFGTPFAGELAKVGENVSAPIEAVFLLAQGPKNRRDSVPSAEVARKLLRNVLFFAQDSELGGLLFQSVCDFAARVPVSRLTFVPDPSVWEFIA